jgi:menaquinone-dependent protoporphyrinogen oxidase
MGPATEASTEADSASLMEGSMPAKILVAYATRYGSTQEVAEAIAETLRANALEVDVQPARHVRTLAGYSAVVLGAPLFMLRWHKDALTFLSRHRKTLMKMPVAIFALGPVHEPHDEKEWQDSGTQLNQALAKFPRFSPVALELFGGKYDPSLLRFPLNLMAGEEPASDIRDWAAIRTWAESLAPKLAPASA